MFGTARLSAEPLDLRHAADLTRMHADERVMRWLGGVRDEATTRRFIVAELQHWEREGFGLVILYEKPDRDFAGRGGLRRATVDSEEVVELAYALTPELQGRGLATEFAKACVETAFGPLGLPEIVAFTMTTNGASRKVMEKCGFAYDRDFERAGLPHALYRLRCS